MKRGTSAARGMRVALLACIVGCCLPALGEPPSLPEAAPAAGVPHAGAPHAAGPAATPTRDPAPTPALGAGRTVGDLLGAREGAGSEARPAEPGSAEGDSLATESSATPARTGALRITFSDYLRVLGWLVVVVALAIGCIWVLRRLQIGTARLGGGRLLEVVARISVGPKQQLILVRVAQRVLLVGTGPEGVTPVAEFRDPEEVMALTGFSQQLASQAGGDASLPASAPQGAEIPEPELAPYRREIHQLKELIGSWRRTPHATRRAR